MELRRKSQNRCSTSLDSKADSRKVYLSQSCHFYSQYILFCLVKKKQIFDIGFLGKHVFFLLMGYQALDYNILYHKQCAEFSTSYACRRVLYDGKHLEHLIQVRFRQILQLFHFSQGLFGNQSQSSVISDYSKYYFQTFKILLNIFITKNGASE